MKKSGQRLDIELARRGLSGSREKAKALIMAGDVRVNGQVVMKADRPVGVSDRIEIRKRYIYASRGAYKIERAIKDFKIDLRGKSALDIGISNGGFTDYLLRHGVSRIIGIDVNTRQVEYNIAGDPRVTLLEMNARYLEEQHLSYIPDIVVMDVSFISILKILIRLRFLGGVPVISLVKPQFEAEKGEVSRGGVILAVEKRIDIVTKLKRRIMEIGFRVKNFTPAGIKGRKGNQEYFFFLEYGTGESISDKMIRNGIEIP